MSTRIDIDQELDRIMRERAEVNARFDTIIEYLQGAQRLQKTATPQNGSGDKQGFATLKYGPGLRILIDDLFRKHRRLTAKQTVMEILKRYPDASSDSIRSQLWRTIKRGVAEQRKRRGPYTSLIYGQEAEEQPTE